MDVGSLFDRIRTSLVARVLVVYVAASWIVLEVVSTFREEFGLPTWFFPVAVGLLLIGLPIILATAIVQQSLRRRENHVPLPDFDLAEDVAGDQGAAGARQSARAASDADPPDHALSRWLTWKRSIAGGVLAFTALGILGAVIVLRGTARVTEAYGAAEDAFAERAWIVVADFEAPPDEPDVADAVREALTLDLQQSKYVNVYSRSQLTGVLRRMELPDTVTVDPNLGRQIAQREGLAAALAGSVSKLGDSYVLGARVLSPESGEELIVVRSTAAPDQLVNAVQKLSREIRARLGESREAIGASEPLPRVTTRSLEALKRYARAKRALNTGEQERAIDLAESAIELDPEFGMAHRLAGVAHSNLGRWAERDRYTTRAYELRDKLTERERLQVEAFYLWSVEVDPVEAAAKYELILSSYPDDSRAANNLAVVANTVGDEERAYRAARRSIELTPYAWQGYGNAIGSARELGLLPVAESLAHRAMERGLTERATRWLWEQTLAESDWARADAVCDSLLAASSPRGEYRAGDAADCGTLDIARGRIDRAIDRLRQAREIRSERGQRMSYYWTTRMLAHAELLRGRPDRAAARLQEALARHPPDSIPKPDRYAILYWASTSAAALDDIATARRFASTYSADTSNWATAAWSLRAHAAGALAADEHEAALEYDRRAIRRHFGHAVMQDQLFRAQAFDGLGQADSAAVLYKDVIAPQRVADNSIARAYLPVIHRRLGELYTELGDPATAARHYQAFVELWEHADPELQPQVESARRALARLAEERPAATSGTH